MKIIRHTTLLLLSFIFLQLYTNPAIGQSAEKIKSVTFSGMSLFKTVGNKWAVADSVSNKPINYIFETSRDERTIHLWVEQSRQDVTIDMKSKTIAIPKSDSGGLRTVELPLSGWSDQLICNGWTVHEVKTNYGSFYKEKGNKWIEADLLGNTIGHFTETNRDSWSVYLLKDDGSELRIDVFVKSTFFTPKGEKPFELYKLTDWLNDARTSGFTVNLVKTATGSFFISDNKTWVSIDSAGKFKGFFTEQQRDDSSVLLSGNNAIKLFIDVKHKKLSYYQPELKKEPIEFNLTDWSNEIPDNGYTVNQVAAGKILFFTMPGPGKWVNDGSVWRWIDKTWIETDSTKKPFANFSEISRSVNSIVLKKDDGLVVRISLADRIIYSQIDTIKERPHFYISSLDKAEFVNGWTVKNVSFSDGAFLQKEGKKWVETNADKKETASFTEVNRDEWSVYLQKEDGSDLRIDLYLKTIFYNAKGEKPFELYKLTGWTNR